jgi:RNA polymerase sigma-70 factor (ECF subfamily)
LSKLNERQLIALAQETLPYDTNFFQQLIGPYVFQLKGYCQKLLNNSADAEDVVQETLIKALTHLKGFKWVVSFKAWLFKIAHNECIDKIRKRKWYSSLGEDELDDLPAKEATPNIDDSLSDMMNKLSFIDRNIILLRYRNGLEFQEIADITEMKLSAVKMRHKRIIEFLREQEEE